MTYINFLKDDIDYEFENEKFKILYSKNKIILINFSNDKTFF